MVRLVNFAGFTLLGLAASIAWMLVADGLGVPDFSRIWTAGAISSAINLLAIQGLWGRSDG